ncbi:MAG: LamG domain-containing protein [Candidatus Aenigmatarchaeota archaeon]
MTKAISAELFFLKEKLNQKKLKKGISAVIATIMLLMITVSLIGVFYIFSSTLATQTTGAGGQQASQLTAQLSMCMQIDNIIGNQVTLRNCGKGVIENKSLVVMMDDVVLNANTQTILEGNSSAVNISGLWNVPFGKHSLKISNGAAVAQSLVDVQPNPDGLAGSWNFDEGSGGKAYDASGNGNIGTLTNMNTSGNATSGWNEGRFREGLQFDGVDDYVNAGNGASLNNADKITIESWIYMNNLNGYKTIVSKGATQNYWFHISNLNKIRFYIQQSDLNYGDISANTVLSANQWYHIVAVYDNSTRQVVFYLNGKPDGGGVYSVGMKNTTWNTLFLGGYAGNSYYFNGTIDEVKIWNRALAPDETVVMKQVI